MISFKSELCSVVEENFEVSYQGKRFCEIRHQTCQILDKEKVYHISGQFTISSEIAPTHHSWQPFPHEYQYGINYYLENPALNAQDFQVPVEMRRKGLGRYLWHLIFCSIPKELRSRTLVYGSLKATADTFEECSRRNQLCRDICGVTAGLASAIFDAEQMYYIGPISDPWHAQRSELEVKAVFKTEVAKA